MDQPTILKLFHIVQCLLHMHHEHLYLLQWFGHQYLVHAFLVLALDCTVPQLLNDARLIIKQAPPFLR